MKKLPEAIIVICVKLTEAQAEWADSKGSRKRSEVIRSLIQAAMDNEE